MKRRRFIERAIALLGAAALARHAATADALAPPLKFATRPWVPKLTEISAAVSAGALSPEDWRAEIAQVLGAVDRADLLRAIDYDRLVRSARFPAQEEGLQRIWLPEDDGRAARLHFTSFLFALAPGVSVVPHGHHNMLSMHMLLQGAARVRHYDRLGEDATHLIIRASSDEAARVGELSSIGEAKDNIHWFQAQDTPVFMFNVQVGPLDTARPSGGRDYVDPLRGLPLGDGRIRAPRLDRTAAYARYARSGV